MWIAETTNRVGLLTVLVMLGGFSISVGKSQNDSGASISETTLRYLDLGHPTISQAIGESDSGIENAKFVQVEIVDVVNPRKYALEFEVSYQSAAGARKRLGTFSLYPADNPGRFIVAARAEVKAGGSIIVSLVVFDAVDSQAPLRVGVRSITFVRGESRRNGS